jgi:hypothetical protein
MQAKWDLWHAQRTRDRRPKVKAIPKLVATRGFNRREEPACGRLFRGIVFNDLQHRVISL